MYIKNQTFLILGVSKSGFNACKLILERGGKCFLYEELKSTKIDNSINTLISLGAKFVLPNEVDDVLKDIDVLVISPGVAINHQVAVKTKELNKRIIGELELGFQSFTPTFVGVTGTNGKTTTVSLIDAILKNEKVKSVLCGNVGIPLTQIAQKVDKDTVCVAEVSSFQLESVSSFCPHISCILNISPDHLERHYTMDNYVFLKKRIFKNQRESEYTVLNFDDNVVSNFAKEVSSKIVYVSTNQIVDGAYRLNGDLYFKNEKIISENQLKIKGEHNVYDVLFAIAVAKLLGVKTETVQKTLMEFNGVRHRIELIKESNGVCFYDDSKATNTASTISAIESMDKPTILILGGSEKGEKYAELFEKIKVSQVKHVVITGASGLNMIKDAVNVGFLNYTYTSDFYYAVKFAKTIAKQNENVLLSPACASFDFFSNYEERGEAFKKIVCQDD